MEAASTKLPTVAPLAGVGGRVRAVQVAQVIARLAALGLLAGTLLLVVAAAQGRWSVAYPLHGGTSSWVGWPFIGLWPLRTTQGHSLQLGLVLVVLAMLSFYAVTLLLWRSLSMRAVWGTVIAVYGVCFLSPPLLLTDIFSYLGYARLGVLHHLNPYTHVLADAPGDPTLRLTGWHHLPSPYGPLFTLGTYVLVPLGLAGSYWVFKAVVMAAALGCLWLVARIARRLGASPVLAVVLVGLNPLVVLYGEAGQHNDWFHILFLLLAIELWLVARAGAAAASVAGAAAAKASAALAIPIMLLARPSRRTFAGAALGIVFFGLLSLAAFGLHLPAIGLQSQFVTAFSIPNIVGLALGHGTEDATIRAGSEIVLGIGAIGCFALAWRRREPIAALGWLTVVTLATLGWDMAWYVLWLLPFIAFIRERAFRIVAIALIVWITLQWTPQMTHWMYQLGVQPEHQKQWKRTQDAFFNRYFN